MKKVVTKQGIKDNPELFSESPNIGESVYEVIRVMDGIALFLEDHFVRLKKSLLIRGYEFEMHYEEFKQHVAELVTLNKQGIGNIKFVYFTNGTTSDWYFSFIPHSYPTQQDYQNGVSVELLPGERENPNAKVIQLNLRERANQMISDLNIYEVLLVNHDGLITEGSRSNMFFVKDSVFYTAPPSKVLVGITRQKVIDCLAELGFSLVELAVSATDIGSFDAAFLTGTSPKVLPIRLIGKQPFNTQLLVIKDLIDSYNNMITRYIESERDIS